MPKGSVANITVNLPDGSVETHLVFHYKDSGGITLAMFNTDEVQPISILLMDKQ